MVYSPPKPEDALERAKNLHEVGKPAMALEILQNILQNRKYHRAWSKTHEEAVLLFLDLCIQQRNGAKAKDGLHQYKGLTGHTAVGSLIDVIEHYLDEAEKRVEQARGESEQIQNEDIDDLEATETPESLLLAMVSAEDSKDRTERAVLTPWLKFLWEAFRHVLDILRNNSKLENLYQKVAKRAFNFCLRYERKREFRTLCETLRKHLAQILHPKNAQTMAVNLDTGDTLQQQMEIRFLQLEIAPKLEQWLEAFNAVDDVAMLMDMANKQPKPATLALYYTKLAHIFWKSGDAVFHAAALHQLFVLSKQQKKNFADDAESLANMVLLATLAVPIQASESEVNSIGEVTNTSQVTDRQLRFTGLLITEDVPTRESLVNDLVINDVINYVSPELRDMYSWLEQKFHPLQLCSKIMPIFEFVKGKGNLEQYVEPLQKVLMTRLFKQLSQIYSTMKFSRLSNIIPFASKFEIENFLVQAAKDRLLQVRVCHRTQAISFGTNIFTGQADNHEGPRLQSLQSDMVRNQLTTLSKRLHEVVHMINPDERASALAERKALLADNFANRVEREHRLALDRKGLIEKRQETIEARFQQRKEEEEEREANDLIEKQRQEEERQKEMQAKNEELRKKKELEEIERKLVLEKIEAMKKTAIGAKVISELTAEELETLSADEIMARQIEYLEKEKREQSVKLRAQEKKVDYFERAKRLEEIDLTKEYYAKQRADNERQWKEQQHERTAALEKEHGHALEMKQKLQPMVEYKNKFIARVMERRRAEFDGLKKDFDQAMQEQDRRMAAERAEREQQEEKRRLQEEKRRMEEQERELREAEEREQAQRETAERLERERKEREAFNAKQNELAEKQRQREREIEERLEREKAERRARTAAEPDDGADTWREVRRDGPSRATREGAATAAGGGGGSGRWERGSGRDDRGSSRDGGRWERGSSRDDRGPSRDERGPSRSDRGDGGRWERSGPRDDRGSRGGDRGGRGGDRGGDRWERGSGAGGSRSDRGPRGGFGDRKSGSSGRSESGNWR